MSYRLACSPILWRPFLNWVSLQSEAISLCQIDRKLPSTVSNGLLPITPCSFPQMEYLESLWTVYFLVFLQPDYIILYLEPISKTSNFFETGYDVVQANLKLVSSSDWLQNSDLLSPSPMCWGHKYAPPHILYAALGIQPKTLCKPSKHSTAWASYIHM